MANLESRITNVELKFRQKHNRKSAPPAKNVFILPRVEKEFQAFIRYAKKHANEQEWVAIILPEIEEIS